MSTLKIEDRDPSVRPAKLRRDGVLPMALLQRDHTTIAVQSTPEDLRLAMKGADSHGRIQVQSGSRKMKAIVKQVDKDFLTQKLRHVLLQEVSEDDMLKMDIAISATGTPVAVSDGAAVLMSPTDHVKVKGKASDLPDHISVDVSELELGHHINAGDIQLPDGCTLLSSPDATLFIVSTVKEVSLEPDTAPEGAVAATEASEEVPASDAEGETEA